MQPDGGFAGTKNDILVTGFYWWKDHCSGGKKPDVKEMIEKLAVGNRSKAGDWAWNDDASKLFNGGSTEEKDEAINMYYEMTDPKPFEELVTHLWIAANGDALALNVCASEHAKPPGAFEHAKCDTGQYFNISSWLGINGSIQCEEPDIQEDVNSLVVIETYNVPII